MNRITASFATFFLAVSPIATHAARSSTPAIAVATVTPAAIVRVTHHRSKAYDVHGQRFVPTSLLRNRDTLINGLPPQPAQFE